MIASIVLNDMNRSNLAAYGYRSWLLQNIGEPYEVILNLFNNRESNFRNLSAYADPSCVPIIKTFKPPRFFNISAANNIGLHFASGKYVVFANSDMVHSSGYLRLVIDEMSGHNLSYMTGSRFDLSPQQTASLRDPIKYSTAQSFDDELEDATKAAPARPWRESSPWIVLRSVAEAIGGFDPNLLCSEENDFSDRAMHYLRRTGMEQPRSVLDHLYGFHLHHPVSELYEVMEESAALWQSRCIRLRCDPESTEDVVDTRLRCLESLLEDLHRTATPPLTARNAVRKLVVVRRCRDALRVLLHSS